MLSGALKFKQITQFYFRITFSQQEMHSKIVYFPVPRRQQIGLASELKKEIKI